MPFIKNLVEIADQLDKNEKMSQNIINSIIPDLTSPENKMYLRRAVRLPLMKFIRSHTTLITFEQMHIFTTKKLMELAVELIEMSKDDPEGFHPYEETDEEEIT